MQDGLRRLRERAALESQLKQRCPVRRKFSDVLEIGVQLKLETEDAGDQRPDRNQQQADIHIQGRGRTFRTGRFFRASW